MEDDCIVPDGTLVIRYKGPNPFRAVQATAKLMRRIWEVEAVAYWERDFRYNPDEDPRGFLLKSYVNKSLDGFSKVIIETIIQGKQPSDPKKEGWCEIKIGGVLKTSFGGNTIFEDVKNPIVKQFYLFYDRYFHRKQRRFYLEYWCRQRLDDLKKAYQEVLGITPAQGG
jgi:hypothetical protein